MATEAVASLGTGSFTRLSSLGGDPNVNTALSNDLRGLSFPRGDEAGYSATFVVPTGTITTGLTFRFIITDDGGDAADLGKAVRFGILAKKLTANATTSFGAAAGTEVAANVTLSSTASGAAVATIAVTNANLGTPSVGDIVAIRIRRISSNAGDTCQGRVIVVGGVAVYGT